MYDASYAQRLQVYAHRQMSSVRVVQHGWTRQRLGLRSKVLVRGRLPSHVLELQSKSRSDWTMLRRRCSTTAVLLDISLCNYGGLRPPSE
jgi:hypothetical protein